MPTPSKPARMLVQQQNGPPREEMGLGDPVGGTLLPPLGPGCLSQALPFLSKHPAYPKSPEAAGGA